MRSGSGQLSANRRECVGDLGAEDEIGQAELLPAPLDLNPALNVSMVALEAPGSGVTRKAEVLSSGLADLKEVFQSDSFHHPGSAR